MKQILLSVFCGVMAVSCSQQQSVQVTVTNALGVQRSGEMVEVPVSDVFKRLNLKDTAQIVIYSEKAEEIPYQLTYDDKIVFPVTVDSCGKATYTIQEGEPSMVNTLVYGRQYPERLDDIAWENDKSGYRVYGPALQQRGDQLYGYDIFTKNIPDLVLEDRYAMELDSAAWAQINALRKAGKQVEADSLVHTISYHVDHGTGMDAYDVGPTLGAGVAALMSDSVHLVYPKMYQKYEILDNGPLRFTMKLTFAPQPVNNDSNVVETRIIQLDKGAQLNKTTVNYEYLSEKTPIAAGIVIHRQNPKGYAFDASEGYVAYADSTNDVKANNGVVYVGVVFPQHLTTAKVEMLEKPAGSAIGHVMGITEYMPEDSFTYYWGSGWSKAGFPTMEDWVAGMQKIAAEVRTPLEVTIEE